MTDLQQALNQITDIRQHVAEAKLFRGFGPMVIGLTGFLALALGLFQAGQALDGPAILTAWVLLALVSGALIGFEMWALSRRAHGARAYSILMVMIEKFMPSFFGGAALGWIILRHAPEAHWILPGLWQVLIAIALFGARSMLPKATTGVAVWYMMAGLVGLLLCSQTLIVSPWSMAIPFGIGQILMAASLKWQPRFNGRQV